MEMVMELVLTALAGLLLSFLVAKLLSAVVGGGERREVVERVVVEERRLEGGSVVGGGRRSGKRVRFVGVEERLVVDWFEGVEADNRVVVDDEGFGRFESVGDFVEKVGGDDGVVGVETASLEGDCPQFEDISAEEDVVDQTGEASGLTDLLPEKSLDVLDKDEVLVDVSGNSVDERRGEQVENADGNKEGKKEEVTDLGLEETADESVAGIVGCCPTMENFKLEEIGVVEANDGGNSSAAVDDTDVGFGAKSVVCHHTNEAVSSAQREHIDELFEENENSELQAMRVENADSDEEEMNKELKPIEKHIRNIDGGVIEEENNDAVNDGFKSEFQDTEEDRKDVQAELKDEPTEERVEGSGEDDWEGIEMSKLDNDFTAAAAFFRREDKDGKLSNIGNEIKMQLYGLQKIVMEGPCREPQPMALKMSARAKWNAWQRLGNMNPDDAMRQYIALVSDINQKWGEQNIRVHDQSDNLEAKKLSASDADQSNPSNESQRKKKLTYNVEGIDTGSSSLEFKD